MNGPRIAVCLAVLLVNGAAAFAQGQMVWGEVGRHDNTFGNGATLDDFGFGAGLTFTIGGDSGQNSGFAVPVGFELRGDKGFNAFDLLSTGDLAFRVRNVSFGPGGNLGFIVRPDSEDSRCPRTGSISSGSSCLGGDSRGQRDIGEFYGIGLSGFLKANFGPQGRAFAQFRYIYYHPDWMYFRSSAEAANATIGTDLEIPTDFPDFESGRDIRIAGGYVFGGAGSTAFLIRGQLVDRSFAFTPVRANSNRMFDQKTRQLTFGIGVAF